jgi:GT2 family glycosyltransferase
VHLWIIKPLRKSAILNSLVLTDYDKNHPVDFVRGACLLVKKEVVEKIGYLDEDYFIYTEETDWCYRMKKAGFTIYYFADAQVIHYSGKSSNNNASELFVQRVNSLNAFYKKHYGERMALLFRVLTLFDITIHIIERGAVNIVRRLYKQPPKSLTHYLQLRKWLVKNI